MNIAPINEPKTMMPPTAATQKVGRAAILRSYSGFLARRCRITNSTRAMTAITSKPDNQGPHAGDGRKVDRQDERAYQHQREDAAEVIDRLGGLIDMRRQVSQRHEQRHHRYRQNHEEDRVPGKDGQQQPGQQRSTWR